MRTAPIRVTLVAVLLAAAGGARAQEPPAAAAAAAPDPAPPLTTTTPAPVSTEKCKIVVLNLVGRGLPKPDEDLPAILTETLAAETGVASGCDVVSQQDIVAMLDYEKQKAVCTDGSDSCLAEIGQALGADRVVAGTVGKLGGDYILAARLMNVKKGAVEQRAEEPVSGKPEQLRRAAKNVGRRLFGIADLPKDAKIDDSPLVQPEQKPLSGLFWAGTVIGGLGAATAVAAGTLALLAELRLGEAAETEKESIQNEGLVAAGVAGGGALLAAAGGVLVGVALLE